MSDPYFEAMQDKWPQIHGLYMLYKNKSPIILYDIHEAKIYSYQFKEFKEELSAKSQVLLEQDYKSASALGKMIVFVRDNVERRLVSYVVETQATRPVSPSA